MAADLHIHVLTDDITEDDMLIFNGNHMGSHYWCWEYPPMEGEEGFCVDGRENHKRRLQLYAAHGDEHELDRLGYSKIANTPDIWIGEVSWLKAAICESDEFLPGPVVAVSELIPDYPHPVLTTGLMDQIISAMDVPNKTQYTVATVETVKEFLQQHLHKRIFTISW